MATGSEHYREAERLAGMAERSDLEYAPYLATLSNAHATLALAAATALGHLGEGGKPYEDDRRAWVEAASEVPAANRRRREAEAAERAEFRIMDSP